MADLELVPLKLFSQRIEEGWTMVTGYPLEPEDWAVMMAPPGWIIGSNRQRGAKSACVTSPRRGRRKTEAT